MRQRGKASFMTEGLVASTYPTPRGGEERGWGSFKGSLSPPCGRRSPPSSGAWGGRGRLTHVPTSPTRDLAEALARSLARSRSLDRIPFSLFQSVLTTALERRNGSPILWKLLVAYSGRTPSELFRRPRLAR